jgi:hypothetical protein
VILLKYFPSEDRIINNRWDLWNDTKSFKKVEDFPITKWSEDLNKKMQSKGYVHYKDTMDGQSVFKKNNKFFVYTPDTGELFQNIGKNEIL